MQIEQNRCTHNTIYTSKKSWYLLVGQGTETEPWLPCHLRSLPPWGRPIFQSGPQDVNGVTPVSHLGPEMGSGSTNQHPCGPWAMELVDQLVNGLDSEYRWIQSIQWFVTPVTNQLANPMAHQSVVIHTKYLCKTYVQPPPSPSYIDQYPMNLEA